MKDIDQSGKTIKGYELVERIGAGGVRGSLPAPINRSSSEKLLSRLSLLSTRTTLSLSVALRQKHRLLPTLNTRTLSRFMTTGVIQMAHFSSCAGYAAAAYMTS